MPIEILIIKVLILVLSVVLHEMAHGYMANWLGDPTARLAGRLSPNPVLHIDPMGSIVIPTLVFFSSKGLFGSGLTFGWAKPVPYNPYNLRNQKWGESLVAVAGPLSNFLLAIIFAIVIRFASPLSLTPEFLDMALYIVSINILLGVFNLIPFPPLDGSKVIQPFLPFTIQQKYRALTVYMERMGLLALFVLIFVIMLILKTPFFAFVFFIERILVGF